MSAIGSLGGSSAPASTGGLSTLTSEDFLEIILTELQTQDPLEPQTTQALIDQMGSLREIESNTKLSQDLGSLVSQNELSAATSAIGSLVSGITLDNRRVADLVVSVSKTADGAVLNLLDGSRMRFSNVDEIVGPLPSDDDDESGPATAALASTAAPTGSPTAVPAAATLAASAKPATGTTTGTDAIDDYVALLRRTLAGAGV